MCGFCGALETFQTASEKSSGREHLARNGTFFGGTEEHLRCFLRAGCPRSEDFPNRFQVVITRARKLSTLIADFPMRRLLSLALLVFTGLACALKIAEWTSENWWMNSLGFGGVQRLYWKWRLQAFFPAFGLWWLVMGGNARLAWHNAHWRDVSLPLLRPRALAGRGQVSPEERARLDLIVRRGARVFITGSAFVCGVAAANHFDLWVMMFHAPDFGPPDASGVNTSFLVGVWPGLLWAWNAFGVLLLFTLGLVAAIATFEGALDFDSRGLHIGDATARHLCFCGALLLLWIGVRCGLSSLGEAVSFGWSPGGVSGFYDHAFARPARHFFLLSSPFLALWFARAAPRKPLRLLVAAGIWSFAALFLPLIAPSFGRAVRPATPSLEITLREENARHIEATRRAWGLDAVQERALGVASSDFLPSEARGENPTVRGLVAWPEEALRRALAQKDTGKGLGRVPGELFIARQGDTLRASIIESNPSLTRATSPLALEVDPARGGAVDAQRLPLEAVVMQSPLAARIPSFGAPGDAEAPPVRARLREVEATTGVARDNLAKGLVLSLRFGDRSLLTAGMPVTWHLDPLERVRTLAPFVWWAGARPHPVWTRTKGNSSGHLFWLVEGCFVSGSFPGSAMLPSGANWSGLCYARQSVLGVCDATTGDTKFFLFDPTEPFSRAWNALLPGFFRPVSELSAPLRAATRLSPALLGAQTLVWTRYHRAPGGTDEALSWSKRSDEWRALLLDTSVRDRITQPVVVQRAGKVGLEQLTAFAPSGGTLASNSGAMPEAPPLVALLGARDEGEAIWNGAGKPLFSSWRPSQPLALPLSGEPARVVLSSPFAPDVFDKRALLLSLDARGNCTGLGISHGRAELQKPKNSAGIWTLQSRFASTKTRAPDAAFSARTDANLARARALWKAWKAARSQGRWTRVEELEGELNRLLAP